MKKMREEVSVGSLQWHPVSSGRDGLQRLCARTSWEPCVQGCRGTPVWSPQWTRGTQWHRGPSPGQLPWNHWVLSH